MTQRNFEIALAKGDIGEQIFRERLEANGWSVFMPVTQGAHHFDMMATYKKQRAIAFDIKSKARMNKYHATGVNQRHFEEYKQFSVRHNMPFWLVFVDEMQRTVYGNELDELEKPVIDSVDGNKYPKVVGIKTDIRIWSLDSMIYIADLTDEQSGNLKSKNQRNYEYRPQ